MKQFFIKFYLLFDQTLDYQSHNAIDSTDDIDDIDQCHHAYEDSLKKKKLIIIP